MNQSGAKVVVNVEDLHKSYGALEVLKGVSMRAHENEVVAILGSSGSGKSTFLRCLNLLEMPDRGRIAVHGEDVCIGPADRSARQRAADICRLRTRLGMVFQQFNLWSHRTVMENVIEGPVWVLGEDRASARARAAELLDLVGLGDKLDVYPGFLSGGQQQRVAIARALAMRPDALLFDEPTSALDPEMVGEVLAIIRQLADEGRTMLIVTHEMHFARDVSDRTVFFHEGRIEEEGPTAEVFRAPRSPHLQRFLSNAG